MNRDRIRVFGLLLAGGASFLSAGCGRSKPSNFYLLAPLATPQSTSGPERISRLVVGIGPVELPKYLDRPQVVRRQGGHRLTVAEFDRWAEPLDANFARVLGENISRLLASEQVEAIPWRTPARVDMRAVIEVVQLDVSEGGDATLAARWSLVDGEGRVLEPWRRSTHSAPAPGAEYEETAAALSQLSLRFAEDIAGSIRSAMGRVEKRGP